MFDVCDGHIRLVCSHHRPLRKPCKSSPKITKAYTSKLLVISNSFTALCSTFVVVTYVKYAPATSFFASLVNPRLKLQKPIPVSRWLFVIYLLSCARRLWWSHTSSMQPMVAGFIFTFPLNPLFAKKGTCHKPLRKPLYII